MESCLFCRIAAKEVPARIVHEDDDCLAFEDINPQAPMHVLVIPRRHMATLNELSDQDSRLAGRLVLVARNLAVERGYKESGFRLVANCQAGAGQSVFHIHVHVLGGRAFQWPPG
jgi:histidine triad (HIT) family protein